MNNITWNISANLTEITIDESNSVVLDFFAVFMTIVAIVGCIVNFTILALYTKLVFLTDHFYNFKFNFFFI